MEWGILLQVLSPFIAPATVWLVKKGLPRVPKVVWPVLTTVFGAVAATIGGADPGLAVALGGSGVAVREVTDQTKKAVA